MRLLNPIATRVERATGLPARFMVPAAVAGMGLNVAVVGMYWDIGLHVDSGRDDALLTLPHLLIVAGLQTIVLAVVLHGLMPGPRARGERVFPGGRFSLSPGGLQMLLCGSVALLGFPLDGVWHGLFGEDVTLWGPTHLFMIGGAGLSTIGLWMLLRHAAELGRRRRSFRDVQWRIAGGLLIGLSTFQAEFDFGVPQFQLLYQPLLIAVAAGAALTCARLLLGPGGALKALAMFILVRGALALFVGPVLGFTTPHFPLYAVEALAVEGAALLLVRRGGPEAAPGRFALLAGVGVGTAGLAAEWGWSHVWMAHPWTASLLPEAAVLVPPAAVAAAVLGTRIAQALREPDADAVRAPAPALPGRFVALAGLLVLVALAVPLPRGAGDGTVAALVPTPAEDGRVDLQVRLEPPDAARGAQWFEVLSWQGKQPREITALREVGPGRFQASSPVPVGGNWKTMVRLADGRHLMAAPVFLAAAPTVDKPAVAAIARTGPMTSDTAQLQRESLGGAAPVQAASYAVLATMVALWFALTCWSLRLAQSVTLTASSVTLRPRPPAFG